MEKINVKSRPKWQNFWSKKIYSNLQIKIKNFIVLKCFLILLEKFIWDMLEITQ